jgi:membrane protein
MRTRHAASPWRSLRRLRRLASDALATTLAALGFLGERQASLLAAGLAFFALISLAPFLVIAVGVGGALFGAELARAELRDRIGTDLGPDVTEFIVGLADGATQALSLSVASVVGLSLLFWSSMRLFAEVRGALMAIWAMPHPTLASASGSGAPEGGPPGPHGGMRALVVGFIRTRLVAALGTVGLGAFFLALLASRLFLSRLLGSEAEPELPFGLWSILEYLGALLTVTVVVHGLYRYLPDDGPRGRALLVGSVITAFLLLLGRSAVGLYVSLAAVASVHGAAGTLIVILIWAYWSALVFLFGARITWALRQRWRGADAPPEDPVSG